ncbi:lipid-A-disaccharide synthase-related protein [Aphanothece sacrum]|uniref:Lipid-A-disaccharide synthase n=1 Tax=Aphanothece sacrum FPU1 TaxID=1920663 RepID=A0A401IBN9_APHSA|nr:lipid-A-disaccharide synthase-related protein [Aphanothece sacrum]GBF78640.1 lipid-A-disaccharide synthase [Aphanothece sacrum FPU1]GBF84929.1 lipid-A-disaccharide synthase [Aphanothece sacrum FPU3]
MLKKQVLFISNGHGEDLNASLILQALVKISPKFRVSAMPLVGKGNPYRRLGVDLITQTQTLPSGGIFYMNPLTLLQDLSAGLIKLTIEQIRTLLNYSPQCDLIVAVGDIFPITMAYITGRPYVAFIVSTSSFYEGKIRLPLITEWCLRSRRCLAVFTRDSFTAKDLQKRGMKKAIFAGYPIMDVLTPTGQDLGLKPNSPVIALLPGSRLPEALDNLTLQLRVCQILDQLEEFQFRVALVPSITETQLEGLANQQGWDYYSPGKLIKKEDNKTIIVDCYYHAFADILDHCDLAIGMAGTAVEQVVGLGKPVIQLPGKGPQFTYAFAEAQMRLLGTSVITIGKNPNNPAIFNQAAHKIQEVLKDTNYLKNCIKNGDERVGKKGGSEAIAKIIAQFL